MHINEIWKQTKSALSLLMAPTKVDTWLECASLEKYDDTAALIHVPDEIHLGFWNENLIVPAQKAFNTVTGKRPKITLETNSAMVLFQPELWSETEIGPSAEPEVREVKRPKPVRGLLRDDFTFQNYVVGAHNQIAHAAAMAVAQRPGKAYSLLFIEGEPGRGKSHLMGAIGAEILRLNPKARVIVTNGEDFVNEFVEAIRNNSLAEFRAKFRDADVLLFDDIEFLRNKERSQEEFFHTFNSFHDGHRQIVLTSDVPLSQLEGFESRLVSRFHNGMVVCLGAPDEETRLAILRRRMEQVSSVTITDSVLRFIAERIKSDIRRLNGALLRVIAFASLHKDRVLTPQIVADEILADLLHAESKGALTIGRIISATASHYGLSEQDLISGGRQKHIAWARHVAMFLSRLLFPTMAFEKIRLEFKKKDHGTIMHAWDTVLEKLRAGQEQKAEILAILRELDQNESVLHKALVAETSELENRLDSKNTGPNPLDQADFSGERPAVPADW